MFAIITSVPGYVKGEAAAGRGTARSVLWVEMLGLFPQPPWAKRGGKAPRGR